MDKKKRLKKECDTLWKQIIISKSPICEVCGKEPTITGHHFYYKSNYPHLRFDLDNGIPIGISCHFTCHHKDPKLITDKIIDKRGENWHQLLKTKSQERLKSGFQTIGWYNTTREHLKALI